MNLKIGFIGVGNMARAIFESLVNKKEQLKESIYLYDIDLGKTQSIKEKFNINIASSITDIALQCDVIVLAVRPHDLESVFDELSEVLSKQVLISVAVGITLEKLEKLAKKDLTIVRTMPNIGAMIGKSITSFCVNKDLSTNESMIIQSFLTSFGQAIQVKEDKFDEFTALCGSSPAFYLEIMNSMIHYGLQHDFTYEDTLKMVSETMILSAELLQKSNLKAKDLIRKIATPGGTTEAGLRVLKKYNIDQVITETLKTTENESKKTK